jgi:hypothetical protein
MRQGGGSWGSEQGSDFRDPGDRVQPSIVLSGVENGACIQPAFLTIAISIEKISFCVVAYNSSLNWHNGEGSGAASDKTRCGRHNGDSFRTVQEPKTGPLEHFENAGLRPYLKLFQQLASEILGEMNGTPSPLPCATVGNPGQIQEPKNESRNRSAMSRFVEPDPEMKPFRRELALFFEDAMQLFPRGRKIFNPVLCLVQEPLNIIKVLRQRVPPVEDGLLLIQHRHRCGSSRDHESGAFSPAQQQQSPGEKGAP